jgi:hemerythrin
MLAAIYPKLPQYRQEHEPFVARVLEVGQNFDPGHPKVVEETLNFVKEGGEMYAIATTERKSTSRAN